LQEELFDGAVCRLAKIKDTFPPESTKPEPYHFRPSSDDTKEAKASGRPVLVSVWDLDRTSPTQAQALMGDDHPRLAFRLKVVDIRGIRAPGRPERLAVFRAIDPNDHRPGADGHCGISGLDEGSAPGIYRLLRAKLCEKAFLIASP
jgi:hypothetical protein